MHKAQTERQADGQTDRQTDRLDDIIELDHDGNDMCDHNSNHIEQELQPESQS